VAVRPGDRFVLRRQSPVETLVGGRVLDPQPARGVARRRTTPERLHALAGAAAGSAAWRAARLDLHGVLAGAPPVIAPDVAAALDRALVATVDLRPGIPIAELVRTGAAELRRHATLPGRPADPADDVSRRIVDARLEQLIAAGRLTRDAGRVAPPGVAATGPSAALTAAMDRLVAALSTVAPPPLGAAAREAGCPPEGVRLLEAANRIIRLDDDLAWAFPTYGELAARAVALAAAGPLTPAAFRNATGTSRKYVMAILEDLDRRAILRRTPAGHVPGPRAAHAPTR
jgi:selenocysteine-specific elongation factor